MQCPQCRADNPADTSFCGKCGSRLGPAADPAASFTRTISRHALGIAKGKTIAGKYRVLEELGRGGMGQVFKAEDLRLHRTVAVKFLSPDLLGDPDHQARFLREARTASALNDPRICVIHEIGEEDGRPFIAMEYVAGRSIQAIIQAGPMTAEDVGRHGLQIAEALQHAHEHGIIHRDLKTANVMITSDSRVKILDFGLAKRLEGGTPLDERTSQKSLTEAGTFLGTMSYTAPEVFRGEPADARSDIWALGVMLYEMASGKLPFEGQTGFELSSAVLRDTPPVLPAAIPGRLTSIILKCLEKDAGRRYQNAGEVRADLDAAFSADLRRGSHPEAKPRRPLWKIAIAGAAVLAVAVGGWILLSQRSARGPLGANGAVVSTGGRASRLPEANEYFEKAMMFLAHQFDLAKARAMPEKSLEIDPAFAEARAWYGFAYILEIDSGYSNDSAFLYKAEEQLRRALQNDPNSARAHCGLAVLDFYQGRKALMIQEINKALKINPQDIDTKIWLGNYHLANDDTASAKEAFRQVLVQDPLFFPARMMAAEVLRIKGDSPGAIKEFDKILELDPKNTYAVQKIARAYIDLNDLRSARLRLEGLPAESRQSFEVQMTWATLLALEGKAGQARKKMDEECLKYAAIAIWTTLRAAEYFAVLGESGKALDWLEKAIRNGDERIEWFRRDPLLGSIRGLPRFRQILDSITYRREQRSPSGKGIGMRPDPPAQRGKRP